jgi:hypothetical protein
MKRGFERPLDGSNAAERAFPFSLRSRHETGWAERSVVHQLLASFERLCFMKKSRLIVWPAIGAVAGLAYWLTIPEPPTPRARIKIEVDTAQISAADSVSSYDQHLTPQNQTPEITVPLNVGISDFGLKLNSPWGRKYNEPAASMN